MPGILIAAGIALGLASLVVRSRILERKSDAVLMRAAEEHRLVTLGIAAQERGFIVAITGRIVAFDRARHLVTLHDPQYADVDPTTGLPLTGALDLTGLLEQLEPQGRVSSRRLRWIDLGEGPVTI